MEEEALKGELYSQFLSLPLEALPRAFHSHARSQLGSCEVSQGRIDFGSRKRM